MKRALLDRIAETRTIGGVPWEPWRNPYWKFNIGGPVHPSREVGGVDHMVGLAAVYASVKLIADGVASLPLQTYRKMPNGDVQRIASSPLFDDPSIIDTPFNWLFKMMTSLLLEGNAWGLITSRSGFTGPDGFGYPTSIEWLPPGDISVQDDEQQPWNPLRTRIYFKGHLMDRSELVHIPGFSVAGRTEGISPMRAFMHLVSQGHEALNYSHDWFRNGGWPPSTFQNIAEEVDTQQAQQIRQHLTDTIRRHEPLVFGRDWEWKPVTVPQNEAAFIQAMQLNATQVASIYGVTPERVGGTRGSSLTYTTQEQESLSMIVDTLRPWLVRVEHAFFPLIPQTQYVRFNTDALLKTDLKTRHEIYQLDRKTGLVSVDEIRKKEDQEPLPGSVGDDYLPLDLEIAMARTTKAVPEAIAKSVTVLSPVAWHGTVTGQLPAAGEQINPFKSPEKILPAPAPGETGSEQQGGGGDEAGGSSTAGEASGPAPMGGNAGEDTQETTGFKEIGGRPVPVSTGNSFDEPAEMRGRVFGPKYIKASHAERQLACRLLHQHLADGRLTDAEFAEREPRALNARSRGQLDELFRDLPLIGLPDQAPAYETRQPAGNPVLGAAAMALVRVRAMSDDDDQARAMLAATNGKAR